MEGSVIDELIFSVSFVGICIYLVWVLILILFGQDQKLKQTQLKEPIKQLIILVLALNEAPVIRQTITNFVAQTANLPQVKMVIIDDASSDQTAQVVNETLQELACESKVQLLQRYLPEALAQVRPFIRQRARWTQGGFDCLVGYWPKILLSKVVGTKAKMEMTFYLLLPFISLATGLANLLVLAFVSWFILLYWPIVVSLLFINSCFDFYILSVYEHKTRRRLESLKKLFFMVIMLDYNYLFYFVIILACYNKIRRQTKWVKTTHVGVGEKA